MEVRTVVDIKRPISARCHRTGEEDWHRLQGTLQGFALGTCSDFAINRGRYWFPVVSFQTPLESLSLVESKGKLYL